MLKYFGFVVSDISKFQLRLHDMIREELKIFSGTTVFNIYSEWDVSYEELLRFQVFRVQKMK